MSTRLPAVCLHNHWGDGRAFLARWQAWREAAPDALDRPRTFIVIDPALPSALPSPALAGGLAAQPATALATELAVHWPLAYTDNLHRIRLDHGRVTLLLARGDVADWLHALDAQVDEIILAHLPTTLSADASHGPERFFKALARLCAVGTTLHCDTLRAHDPPPRRLQAALRTAGFEPAAESGIGEHDGLGPMRAHYAPRYTPRTRSVRPAGAVVPAAARHAVIVGAGLAGCATAWALAEAGWRCTLIERHPAPAQETSGNPGGLYHSVVHAQDGTHARFNRAAALMLERLLRQWAGRSLALGTTGPRDLSDLCDLSDPPELPLPQGLLRLSPGGDLTAMRAILAALSLPPQHVQALDAQQASALAGVPLSAPAWHYPGGGCLSPAALCRAYLAAAGAACVWCGGESVASLQHDSDGTWHAQDASGHTIASAPVVVLAQAGTTWPLLRSLGLPAWPVEALRGQISQSAALPGARTPRLPLVGAGYVLPAHQGEMVFGATSLAGDMDPTLRAADHAHNLAQLARLLAPGPLPVAEGDTAALRGRVGWRQVSDDRLPAVGRVPCPPGADGITHAPGSRRAPEHPRQVARWPGLFVFGALGSRGIAWSALGAQVLAAQISGAPVPLENKLVDAIDPARWLCRSTRQRPATETD